MYIPSSLCLYALISFLCCFLYVECFSTPSSFSSSSTSQARRLWGTSSAGSGRLRCQRLQERRSNRSRRGGDEKTNGEAASVPPNGFPQLPPIGASSLKNADASARSRSEPFVANHKFQLQYTCNICETRNFHNVSRLAYRQGVVIARCKGCDCQHLIADNLGWTDHVGGFQGNETNTIEDYFNKDDQGQRVSRVSTEVFELEKLLKSYDSKSGAILGDDGKLAME